MATVRAKAAAGIAVVIPPEYGEYNTILWTNNETSTPPVTSTFASTRTSKRC